VPISENSIWGTDWADVRRRWLLDPEVAHCNHGSFGAVPAEVLAVQDGFRQRMVTNPMRWFSRDMPELLVEARAEVARFLRAEPNDVAFVSNVSAGVSTVLQSMQLGPGDEVLCTDHAYGAVSLAMDRLCVRTGATRIIADVPVESPDAEIVARLEAKCSERTRVVVIDQVTSPTARRFPVEAVARLAHRFDAAVLVDGAHAVGMLDLDVPGLGVDFWTGNLHKWPCAPAGTGALWVAPAWHDRIQTLTVSHGEREGYPTAFDHTGTNDLSAWLAAPVSLRMLGSLGWDRVRSHNEALVRAAQSIVAEVLGIPSSQLRHDRGLSLAIVPLPIGLADDNDSARSLHRHLIGRGIESAMPRWKGRGTVRLSAHVYNSPADYERLALGIRDFITG
jgi:isopenicillin-N epimerase